MQIGWWTYDAETRALINRVSGQRVRFEDAAELMAGGLTRLRFTYEDAQVRYPALVTARRETYGGPGYDHGDASRRSLAWSIDHNASAADWRRGCGAATEVPSYGLWRRVDAALFDALDCWPTTEAAGPEPERVDAWGGWLNGAWSPRLRRCGWGWEKPKVAVESGVVPYLEALDTPPPSWRFVDAPLTTAGATFSGVRTLRSGLHALRRDAQLTGFETMIPHLRRHDGKAVMYPQEVRSTLDKDGWYTARAIFVYADEDVFFRLEGESWPNGSSPGRWRFALDDLTDIGVRSDEATATLPADLIRSRQIYDFRGPYLQPLPQLAQRLTTALIDGWLAWTSSPRRLLDDPKRLAWHAASGSPEPMPPLKKSGIDLAAKPIVAVNYGYHGGRFVARSTTGYLQQEGWTEAGFPMP
jgi:hypothetical protein